MRNYKYSRAGKGVNLKPYNNIKISFDVPNVKRYFSVQSRMNCWICVNPEINQKEMEFHIFKTKKKIKDKIREWNTGYFKPESIVAIDTTKLVESRKVDHQFLNIDITHFVKDKNEYEKNVVVYLLEPFLREIIDEYIICTDDIYEIINKKSKARKLVM
jgi:hypothetical protein